MKLFVFVSLLAAIQMSFAADLKRLDPHGALELNWKSKTALDLKSLSQCTTCHVASGNTLAIKGSPASTCANCHNASPHSGSQEHMGKSYNGQAMTCLSCHRPHRAHSDASNPVKSGGAFFSPSVTAKAPEGFNKVHFEGASSAMLSRQCTECHKW